MPKLQDQLDYVYDYQSQQYIPVEVEVPYDDSMECDDAYNLSDEEKAKLDIETEELLADLPF